MDADRTLRISRPPIGRFGGRPSQSEAATCFQRRESPFVDRREWTPGTNLIGQPIGRTLMVANEAAPETSVDI